MNEPNPKEPRDEIEEPDTAAGGQDTVQAMHDIFMREQAEPRDGFEPVPMWVPVLFAILLMWGGYYLGSNTGDRSEEHTSELQSHSDLVCRLLLEKKKKKENSEKMR